jgi:hypothetical protein
MSCKTRCPTCGSITATPVQYLTEDEIVSVITKPPVGFDENRAKVIANALVQSGLNPKHILDTFTYDDYDVVNKQFPEIRLLLGEAKRIMMSFETAKNNGVLRRTYY